MTTPIQIQGILKPDGTLELCEKPNLPPGPVSVTLVPVTATDPPAQTSQPHRRHGLAEMVDLVRRTQHPKGEQPRSARDTLPELPPPQEG
jgi:hypothetical protein